LACVAAAGALSSVDLSFKLATTHIPVAGTIVKIAISKTMRRFLTVLSRPSRLGGGGTAGGYAWDCDPNGGSGGWKSGPGAVPLMFEGRGYTEPPPVTTVAAVDSW
jgi:hypothetical protein